MRRGAGRMILCCSLAVVLWMVPGIEGPEAGPGARPWSTEPRIDASADAGRAGEGAGETPEFETRRLEENLHRVAFSWGMRNNVVVLSGPEGFLLVDSGFNARAAEILRKALGELSGGEVRFVLNTHSNLDHVAGNGIVGPAAAVIGFPDLGGEALRSALTRAAGPLRGRTGRELPAPYHMRFGGEEVGIIPYPGLHSADDVLIHFAKSRVVCMGDLLLSQNCPAVQDAAGYMEFLEKVIDVFPEGTLFVSGHGRDLTLSGLRKYRDDLAAMNAIVRKGFEAGKSAEEMKRSDILKSFKPGYSFLEWLGPDWWIDQVCAGLGSGRRSSVFRRGVYRPSAAISNGWRCTPRSRGVRPA